MRHNLKIMTDSLDLIVTVEDTEYFWSWEVVGIFFADIKLFFNSVHAPGAVIVFEKIFCQTS